MIAPRRIRRQVAGEAKARPLKQTRPHSRSGSTLTRRLSFSAHRSGSRRTRPAWDESVLTQISLTQSGTRDRESRSSSSVTRLTGVCPDPLGFEVIGISGILIKTSVVEAYLRRRNESARRSADVILHLIKEPTELSYDFTFREAVLRDRFLQTSPIRRSGEKDLGVPLVVRGWPIHAQPPSAVRSKIALVGTMNQSAWLEGAQRIAEHDYGRSLNLGPILTK